MSDRIQELVRINFYRRAAKRLGLDIQKSRGKLWKIGNQQGWRIWDTRKDICIVGRSYEMDFDEVIEFLAQYERTLRSK